MTSKTVALPLESGIDNLICFNIIDYMMTNVWMSQVFHSAQYAYFKDDLASKQRPGVFCSPLYSKKDSFAFSQNGEVCLELRFSLQGQRINLAQSVIQIANLIQLINTNQQFTQYAQQNMSGLFWIGKMCRTDYSKIYAKESVVKIIFDYKVDLLAYQQGLRNAGFDITSPDEQIYLAAQSLLLTNELLNDQQQPVIITQGE